MAPLREIRFVKGHGTGNDFVIVPDLDGVLELSVEDVRFLCDRRFGIGADGVLRVVRTAHVEDGPQPLAAGEFFMDYRNADGSIAEMCGNGARVFVRYLDATGLVTDPELVFATRGGLRWARINADLTVTVDMGEVSRTDAAATVTVDDRTWEGRRVHVPNPHAVVFVDDLSDAGALTTPPTVEPAALFPDGTNVEFVVDRGPGHIAMRVHERGVGETLSCGTGACAAAWAASHREGTSWSGAVTVDVPGGSVQVEEQRDGHLWLTGPADLVARGTVLLPRA